jgi:hypothetical protein
LPSVTLGILPLVQTSFRPSMSEVHEQDKSDQNEQECSNWYDVFPVEHEEFVGDKKREEREEEEGKEFRSPPTVLNGGSFGFCRFNAKE